MGRIVVEVMPKPEILDPQGKAVMGSLPRLGFDQFTAVRQGRRFELSVDGAVTEADLEAAAKAAEVLLSNPIIEDVVSVRVVEEGCCGGSGCGCGAGAPDGQGTQDAESGAQA